MTILNFILDHLVMILMLAGLLIIALILWAFWEDEKRYDKRPVCKSASVPDEHAPKFKTPFQAGASAEEKADYKFRDFPGEKQANKAKPNHHSKPRKH